MTKNEKLLECLEGMTEAEIQDIHNQYCDVMNYPDDTIFSMEEFDEICYGLDPLTIAQRVYYGDFNPSHDYFKFDGYANFESSDWASDWVDFDALADYIEENEDDLGYSELEDILFDAIEDEDED